MRRLDRGAGLRQENLNLVNMKVRFSISPKKTCRSGPCFWPLKYSVVGREHGDLAAFILESSTIHVGHHQ